MPPQRQDDLAPHPLLKRLLDAGENTRAFRGYVGPENDRGRVRLYPSLGDLSFFIEINKADIVASAAAPESLLPHGGTVIWVKPEAEVVCRGDQVNTISGRRPRQARAVEAVSAGDTIKRGSLVEVETGRLHIMLRPRVMSSCASCTCSSCEPHPGCTSTCNQMRAKRQVVVGP